VKEVLAANRAGRKVEQLQDADAMAEVVEEPTYRSEEDSITRFDKAKRRNKRNNRKGKERNQQGSQQGSQPGGAKSEAAAGGEPSAQAVQPEQPKCEGGEEAAARSNNRNNRNRNNRHRRPNHNGGNHSEGGKSNQQSE